MSTFSFTVNGIIIDYKEFLYKTMGKKEGQALTFRQKIRQKQLLFPNHTPYEIDIALYKILKNIHKEVIKLRDKYKNENKIKHKFLVQLENKILNTLENYYEIDGRIINPHQEICRYRINLINLENLNAANKITEAQRQMICDYEDDIKKLSKYLSSQEKEEITNWFGRKVL
jgi:hypothetical protein